jgi:hypothetical protein
MTADATAQQQRLLDERTDPLRDLGPRPSECLELLVVGALDLGRVFEPPVERFVDAGKDRANLAGAVAHGDDIVELAVLELRGQLRSSGAPVDADLSQGSNGARVDALGLRPGRIYVEVAATVVFEQGFGDLAARGVAGADEEDADGLVGHEDPPDLSALLYDGYRPTAESGRSEPAPG